MTADVGRSHRDPEVIRAELLRLLAGLEQDIASDDLRQRVKSLVPVAEGIRELGSSVLSRGDRESAKARMLAYLRQFSGQVIDGAELMVVAGISEYARRLRELRVQEGWPILSGLTMTELRASLVEEGTDESDLPRAMRPDQYVLERDQQNVAAAERWQTANAVRRGAGSVRDKILRFLRAFPEKPIHSEELRYVAGNKTEWARRTRELRTEEGWPIVTKSTGDPSLPIGIYVLAKDEQSPPHDRKIPVLVRRAVMQRDQYSCRWRACGWPRGFDIRHDHRFLEVHHIEQHVHGGSNDNEGNLVTLCNLHHDEAHRSGQLDLA